MIFVVLGTLDVSQVWNPGAYGTFGITFGESDDTVVAVAPGSAAQSAGLKPGDLLEPGSPGDRSLLFLINDSNTDVPVGQRINLVVSGPGPRRALTLQARPITPLSLSDSLALVFSDAALLMLLLVALFLVLFRPSKMTWSFYFVALSMLQLFSGNDLFLLSFVAADVRFWFAVAQDFINIASIVGFLVFCIRFPTNAPKGWHKVLDDAALFIFVALAILLVRHHIAVRDIAPAALRYGLFYTIDFSALTILVLGMAILLLNFLKARGDERQRIKWVVLGTACTFVAVVVWIFVYLLNWVNLPGSQTWWNTTLTFLPLVLSLTVIYAVIRHRVIDVHFVLSRSIVFAVIAAIVALVVLGVEWLFSKKLPASRFEVVAYSGVALLVGFSLNTARESIGKIVDMLFFHQWHHARQQTGFLSDAMRQADSTLDVYEPLTNGTAGAMSLASAALFERVEDGGFVRVAAYAWSAGTLWHLLLDDPLVLRVANRPRSTSLDAFQWHGDRVPPGNARPAVVMPIFAGGRVAAIVVYGAHENGTSVDADEIRLIRRLCAEAGLVYGRSRALEWARPPVVATP